MKTALLVIATGEKYRKYAKTLIESSTTHLFDHEVILFTDNLISEFDRDFCATNKVGVVPTVHKGFPEMTLKRYHIFVAATRVLAAYQYLFYVDADMLFVDKVVESDILSSGITATLHPGYLGSKGTPELRAESTAYCPAIREYYCGGFQGGSCNAFLDMAETLRENITADEEAKITAVWHDESHINKYLYDHPPTRVLSPSFCFPESEYQKRDTYYSQIWDAVGQKEIKPKLLALDKK